MKTKFKDFINEEEDIQYMISEMIAIMEDDTLMESFDDDELYEAKLKSIGKSLVHAHKGNRSLIKYFKSAGKGLAKMFMAAIRGDTDTVKAVASSIKASDVLDFLLKLDAATLHLITGPIHTIDAITGWHIWANIEKAKKGMDGVAEKIKQAIATIKQNIGDIIGGKKQREYLKYLDVIDRSVSDPTSFSNIALK